MKKLGKILALASLAGAAAAGVYYFLLKDDVEVDDDSDNKEVKKFFPEDKLQSREYVSLNPKTDAADDEGEGTENTREVIKNKLEEATKEAAKKEAELKDKIGIVKDEADKADDFEFEEFETEEEK